MTGGLREAWEELRDTPMDPCGTLPFTALSALFALITLVQAGSREGWVPLLDGVNLLFHEAGHPLFSPFGETLHILGGTLMQLLVPLAVAGSAWWKRKPAGTAFGLFWTAQNLHNIARYVADARAEALPLVGGGEHDWATLLGAWGLLERDTALGGILHAFGWLGMALAWGWLAWRWWVDRSEA